MTRLADLQEGSYFKMDALLGLVIQRTTAGLDGAVTSVRVRTWDTTQRAMVEVDGRQFLAMKKAEGVWSNETPVEPISQTEYRAIATLAVDRSTLPVIQGNESAPPEPTDDQLQPPSKSVAKRLKVQKEKREPEPEKPPSPKRKNLCICGCGTLVEKVLQRGHYMRLRNWADDLRRGEITEADIHAPALAHMREKGLL